MFQPIGWNFMYKVFRRNLENKKHIKIILCIKYFVETILFKFFQN